MAMLLILLPVSLISRTLRISVDTEAIRLVVHPLALVNVTVGMEEGALSASLIVLPLTLVVSLVDPDHLAFAVAQTALPLAIVDRTCAVSVHALDEARVVLVGPRKRLLRLVTLKVFALHLAGEL